MTTLVETKQTAKAMYADTDAAHREAALAEACDKSEPSMVQIPFTDQEKQDMKDELSIISIQTADAEKIKADALKQYTANIKILEVKRRALLGQLKAGFIEKEEMLYAFADQDTSMMEYYNKEGVLQHSRRLLPDEKQTRIK